MLPLLAIFFLGMELRNQRYFRGISGVFQGYLRLIYSSLNFLVSNGIFVDLSVEIQKDLFALLFGVLFQPILEFFIVC